MSIILACGARPLSSINCNATRSIIDNNQQYPVLIIHVFAATWNGLNSEQMCESRPDCMVNKTWREFTRHTVSIVFECNSYINTHSTVSLDVNGILFGVVYNESSKSIHLWETVRWFVWSRQDINAQRRTVSIVFECNSCIIYHDSR